MGNEKDSKVGKYEQGEELSNAVTGVSENQDDAMVPTLQEPRNLSAEELKLQKKLVRKIDLRLMPCLILLYILNYLDRNSPSAARDNGLVDDLRLGATQYSTTLSILYVGYILFQIPSNLLLAKFKKPRIYIPCCVAIWGLVSGLSAVVNNFTGLLLIRFFLGVVESAFFPGALFLISSWYTKAEISVRMSLLYSGSILSNAVAGLISAGILGGMEGSAGIRGWRWLFIVEGAITIFIAFISYFILPDMPENTSFLSESETQLALKRLVLDSGETDASGAGALHGLKEALMDFKVWILTFLLTAAVISVSFNAFFPTIVGTLGYSHITTLLVTFGPWFFAFLCVIGNSLHADKTRERCFHIILPFIPGIVGFIIASCTTNLGARFFALFIMASSYAGYTIILSWIPSCIPRPTYKRAAGIAFINAFSQLGNISGSYLWPKEYGPSYWKSNLTCACMALVVIGLSLFLRFYLQRQNAFLDRICQDKPDGTAVEDIMDEKEASLELKLMARSNIRYIV